MGGYTGVFNNRMVLYQSTRGGVYKLRDFFFIFNSSKCKNMSDPEWTREVDERTGKEIFRMK